MGDDAVIVRGVTPNAAPADVLEAQRAALHSTVHGAGRVSPEMMQAWVSEKGVVLRGGGLDESPHVYRRLPDVLAAQEGTVDVLHTLRPLIVVMAGENEFDPYKD